MKTAYCIHIRDDWQKNIDFAIDDANKNQLKFVDADTYVNGNNDDKLALMTFDDGREQRYTQIPIYLRERNIKALSFILMMNEDMTKLENDWNFWRNNSDVFDVGAHSITHSITHSKLAIDSGNSVITNERVLKRRNNIGSDFKHGLINREYNGILNRIEDIDDFKHRVMSELTFPKQLIERQLGKECKAFAYPWAVYNNALVTMVQWAGYKYAFGVNTGTNDNKYTLARKLVNN